MIFKKTNLERVYIISLEPICDNRGYFMRTFCKKEFKKHGINFNVCQISRSFNIKKSTLRGVHFQDTPYEENKFIQVLRGEIFDVVVDLRKNSITFGEWIGERLSEKNKKGFYIPKGFGHGFQTLTDNCELEYLMDKPHHPTHAKGIRWDDPFLKIKWPLKNPTISENDKNWPLFKSYDFEA